MRKLIFQDLTPFVRHYLFRAMWKANLAVVMMLLGLAIGSPTALSQTESGEAWKQKLPKPPIPVTEMQVTAYSNEFASRFGLVDPSAELIVKAPIHAMRLLVEITWIYPETQIPIYDCTLQVFFDNSLPIDYPWNEKVWIQSMYVYSRHWERLRTLKRMPANKPLPDLRLLGEKGSTGHMFAAIGTADFDPDQRKGAWSTYLFKAFDREIVPGLAYIEIGGCPSPRHVTNPAGLELWLKKSGAPDFRKAPLDYSAFIRFSIPGGLLDGALPWLEWVGKYSRIEGQEASRRARERGGPYPQVQQWLRELDDPNTAGEVDKVIRDMERRSTPPAAK